MIQHNLPSRRELAQWYFKRLPEDEKAALLVDFEEEFYCNMKDDELADWNWESNLDHNEQATICDEYLAETRCPSHPDTLASGQFGGFCSRACMEQQHG